MSTFLDNWLPNIVVTAFFFLLGLLPLRPLLVRWWRRRRAARTVGQNVSTPLPAPAGNLRFWTKRIAKYAAVVLVTNRGVELAHTMTGVGVGHLVFTGVAVYGLFLAGFLIMSREAPVPR